MASAHGAILLSFMQRWRESVGNKKILIIPDPQGINRQLRQKLD